MEQHGIGVIHAASVSPPLLSLFYRWLPPARRDTLARTTHEQTAASSTTCETVRTDLTVVVEAPCPVALSYLKDTILARHDTGLYRTLYPAIISALRRPGPAS